MSKKVKCHLVAALVTLLMVGAAFPVVAEGPTAPERSTAEIVAEVDARVAATVARIEGRAAARRATSLARVEARLAEIWATRRCPVLPPAAGTWRGIMY